MFDKTKGKWVPWMDTLEQKPLDSDAEYSNIIVPTVDTVRRGAARGVRGGISEPTHRGAVGPPHPPLPPRQRRLLACSLLPVHA